MAWVLYCPRYILCVYICLVAQLAHEVTFVLNLICATVMRLGFCPKLLTLINLLVLLKLRAEELL